jgi:hypothetical protein
MGEFFGRHVAPGNHGGTLSPPQPIMEKICRTMTPLWVIQ